jgi:hypothetical protein
VLAFLRDLAEGLESFIEGIRSYLAAELEPGRTHAALALEHGIAVHQASLDWARSAYDTLSGGRGSRDHPLTGMDGELTRLGGWRVASVRP